MKGQSAIEYLATYGWMILAVSVVAAVAYTNIQSACTRSSADFYTDSIEIKDFGVDGSGNFVLALQNTRYQEIKINDMNISIDDQTELFSVGRNMSPGEQIEVSADGFRTTRGCNTMTVKLVFQKGGLNSQEAAGIIRAPIGFNNSN